MSESKHFVPASDLYDVKRGERVPHTWAKGEGGEPS